MQYIIDKQKWTSFCIIIQPPYSLIYIYYKYIKKFLISINLLEKDPLKDNLTNKRELQFK